MGRQPPFSVGTQQTRVTNEFSEDSATARYGWGGEGRGGGYFTPEPQPASLCSPLDRSSNPDRVAFFSPDTHTDFPFLGHMYCSSRYSPAYRVPLLAWRGGCTGKEKEKKEKKETKIDQVVVFLSCHESRSAQSGGGCTERVCGEFGGGAWGAQNKRPVICFSWGEEVRGEFKQDHD